VTDLPFVHGRDDLGLLGETPALKDLTRFVRKLEKRYRCRFIHTSPEIRSNVADAELAVQQWVDGW
jgi:hypothetical protein